MPATSPARRLGAALAWVVGGAAGWALVPVMLLDQGFQTYREVAVALPGYLLLGAAAGAIMGLWQALAWRVLGQPARRWLWASVAGYALALPVGLIISTLVPLLFGWQTGFSFALPWSVPGSLTYYATPSILIYGGFLAGVCQWAALRLSFDRPTRSMRLLWICGVWLGIGLGVFAGGLAANGALLALGVTLARGPYMLLWGLGWGATIGVVSAAVLWILRRAQGLNVIPQA